MCEEGVFYIFAKKKSWIKTNQAVKWLPIKKLRKEECVQYKKKTKFLIIFNIKNNVKTKKGKETNGKWKKKCIIYRKYRKGITKKHTKKKMMMISPVENKAKWGEKKCEFVNFFFFFILFITCMSHICFSELFLTFSIF